MLAELTYENFEGHVGDRFELAPPEGDPIAFELMEATRLGGPQTNREPFSLVFRGPREPILEQATYRLEHGTVGALEIFLVPLTSGEAGTDYEAVFT